MSWREKKTYRNEEKLLGQAFKLERDLSLARGLTELRICAQELLNAKVKRQISSNGYLYLPLKVVVRVFPPIKLRKSSPLNYHRTVEHEEHRAARI